MKSHSPRLYHRSVDSFHRRLRIKKKEAKPCPRHQFRFRSPYHYHLLPLLAFSYVTKPAHRLRAGFPSHSSGHASHQLRLLIVFFSKHCTRMSFTFSYNPFHPTNLVTLPFFQNRLSASPPLACSLAMSNCLFSVFILLPHPPVSCKFPIFPKLPSISPLGGSHVFLPVSLRLLAAHTLSLYSFQFGEGDLSRIVIRHGQSLIGRCARKRENGPSGEMQI